MKQTLHTSRRAIRLALLCLMAFVTWGGNFCIAQEVTLDFTQNDWKLPTSKKPATKGEYTYNGVTISIEASKNFYYNSGYLMLKSTNTAVGKLTLPAFNFAVEKIEVVGNSGASGKTMENIYVGNTAVSTEKKGSASTNAFVIDKQYQAAGTIYTLQVSAANAQITYIKIYKRAVDLTETTLTLSAIPTEPIAIGGTFSSTPTLKAGEQTLSDKTITWSSDNDKVATVDAATGTVTGVAAGKANITAKFAGDDTYKTSKASYEIIVKGAPALSFPETSYMVEMGDAFSTPKLNGLPEGVTPAYTSSNKEVATVDAVTGEVNIVGVGTTTITVTSPNIDIYEEATASYELTVNRATSKEVTIDFSTFGYTDQQKVTEVSQDGIKLLFAKDTKYGAPAWLDKGNAVRMYKKSSLKITATSNIKRIEFVFDGTNSLEGVTCTSGKYDEAKGLWIFTDVKTKEATITNGETKIARIQKIIVTTELPTSAGAINIATEEGFGTFYTDKNYVLPQGLTAFGYTSIDGNNTLTKSVEYVAGDIVPANTAVVVKGAKGSYNYYNTEEVATKTIENNLLKGVTTDTKIEAKSGVKRYILTRADDGILAFYRTNTGNINVKANRAYLEVPTAMAVASFSLEGTATGINNVVTTAAKQGIYTISGVRLNATTTKGLPAGIYIVNGKKVIVK